MDAVVLAAGQSRRFIETGGPCPKQLYKFTLTPESPFQYCLLSHHISQLADTGAVGSIYVVLYHNAREIMSQVTSDFKGVDVDIKFVVRKNFNRTGTFSSLWQARHLIKSKYYLCTMGDHIISATGLYNLIAAAQEGHECILVDTEPGKYPDTTCTTLDAIMRFPHNDFARGKIYRPDHYEIKQGHGGKVLETGAFVFHNDLAVCNEEDYEGVYDYYMCMTPTKCIGINPHSWININTFQDISLAQKTDFF